MNKPTTRSNRPQTESTAHPEKYPQGWFREKSCKECGDLFKPIAPSNLYCSDECCDIGHQRNWLRKNYNITLEFYQELFNSQQGKCKICGSEGFAVATNQRQLVVIDHCHKSGVVRGLLCHNCNRGLGLFKDNVDNLKNAIWYLERATTIENQLD